MKQSSYPLKNYSGVKQIGIDVKVLKNIASMPRINLETVKTYHIRENFQEIYKEVTPEGFERVLKKWYFWATHLK